MKFYTKSMQEIFPGLRAWKRTFRLIAKAFLILAFLVASMAQAAIGETVWPGIGGELFCPRVLQDGLKQGKREI